MATKQEIKQELARLTKLIQRDELNIVEHVIGIAAERVPIDPATKREITSIRVERTIHEANGITADGFWEATGDPNHGGLPRGYDLDLFNAIMAVWGRGDPRQRLISDHSLYQLLQLTGRDAQTRSYRRLRAGLDRLYGLSINTYATIYDPAAQKHRTTHKFRLFSGMVLEETDEGELRRGMIRLSEEFFTLLQLRYWKITDAERYWRLPTTYTRQLFQYLDKHRYRAREQTFGLYHLAKRVGTADETLRRYRPAKLRDIMGPHFEELVKDGYLAEFRFAIQGRKESRGQAVVKVAFADWHPEAALNPQLSLHEMAAINTIMAELKDERSRSFYEQRALELGADALLELYDQSIAYCGEHADTDRAKHFVFMVERHRGAARP
jgi:plasmid replication initiation protein